MVCRGFVLHYPKILSGGHSLVTKVGICNDHNRVEDGITGHPCKISLKRPLSAEEPVPVPLKLTFLILYGNSDSLPGDYKRSRPTCTNYAAIECHTLSKLRTSRARGRNRGTKLLMGNYVAT